MQNVISPGEVPKLVNDLFTTVEKLKTMRAATAPTLFNGTANNNPLVAAYEALATIKNFIENPKNVVNEEHNTPVHGM